MPSSFNKGNADFMKHVYTFLLFCHISVLSGQVRQEWTFALPWQTTSFPGKEQRHFEEHPTLAGVPVFVYEHKVAAALASNTRLTALEISAATVADSVKARITNQEFLQHISIDESNGAYFLRATILPLRRKQDGSIEKLLSARLECTLTPLHIASPRSPQTTNSVLTSGTIVKIAVTQTGIQKIDKTFLENKLGIATAGLNPKHLRLFGGRGGRLPESNAASRIDDLAELAIQVTGEEDGRFDAADALFFYGEGPDIWKYDGTSRSFTFDKNIYDNANYYFLIINGENGLRIPTIPSPLGNPEISTKVYDRLQRIEEDKVNLLGSFIGAEGTGKDWYGEYFNSAGREKNLTSRFDFQNLADTAALEVEFAFAGRSKFSSSLSLTIGTKTISRPIASVSTLDQESLYARRIKYAESLIPSSVSPEIKLTYPVAGSDAEGWLDYLQIITSQKLVAGTGQFAFRNRKTITASIAAFVFDNTPTQEIWDITNPLRPVRQTLTGNTLPFRPEGLVREFVYFPNQSAAFEPTAIGKVPNQNIHGMEPVDMLVVYHPLFQTAAQKLAEHRQSHSGITVAAIQTSAIYNEFSSGKADPGAIRDFARMMYLKNPGFKYLLLFGDGSYDYKGLVKEVPAENFVPSYQTDESLHPIDGFPSDDFYGLLGLTEGVNLTGELDIYVGRLPAKTADEAMVYVDKIVHYETSPECFGDWKLRAGYVADDEDGNTHLRDMDDVAKQDEARHPLLNQQKVYIDAYRQVSTPGENRYPEVNKTIFDNIFKGQLTMTYLGHGGPLGWSQERILTVPEIQSWTNYNRLPVMVTATCSFGAFDEPAVISPAEYALANPKGGAIALMTTTRAVYTNSNKQLTDAVHEEMFKKTNGNAPSLGYIMTQGKNKYKQSFFVTNSRKFTLLGDPSMSIALPDLDIVTTKINGRDASTLKDTLHALELVEVEGVVVGPDGSVATGFNGTIYPTVFDKKVRQQTLANDESSSKYEFTLYRNTLFKGAASVKNGKWTFRFWIPKNINYTIGEGRISYYATNESNLDAAGFYDSLILGGSSENVITDDEGPEMALYMNDFQFENGGITNANPVLLIALKDDLGIDVTGNAIGQDITAVLDGDTKSQFILNDFYYAEKDDFTKGIVRFPLTNLSPGEHAIQAKAWDISGNSTTKSIRFVVAEPTTAALVNAVCYPNPFTDQVLFQFEHDLTDQQVIIRLDILDATGKKVKSISQTQYSTGFKVNDIIWEGKNSLGDELAKGMYFCRMAIQTPDGSQYRESSFLKLIKI
jgi:hypothetical protein